MKTTTNRLVDPAGRVSIPGYIRELVGINPGDNVTVEACNDNSIRIYAASDRCCICGEGQEGTKLLDVTIGPNKHKFCVRCARAICNTLKK